MEIFELLKVNITFKAINEQKNKPKRHYERWNYKNTKESKQNIKSIRWNKENTELNSFAYVRKVKYRDLFFKIPNGFSFKISFKISRQIGSIPK